MHYLVTTEQQYRTNKANNLMQFTNLGRKVVYIKKEYWLDSFPFFLSYVKKSNWKNTKTSRIKVSCNIKLQFGAQFKMNCEGKKPLRSNMSAHSTPKSFLDIHSLHLCISEALK